MKVAISPVYCLTRKMYNLCFYVRSQMFGIGLENICARLREVVNLMKCRLYVFMKKLALFHFSSSLPGTAGLV